MNAIVRLVHSYFFGNRVLRWLSVAACVLAPPIGISAVLLPRFIYRASRVNVPGFLQGLYMTGYVVLFFGVFFGAALMPVIALRLATSRYMYVLPYGRLKLLASVMLTLLLIILVWTLLLTAPYFTMPIATWIVLLRSLTAAFLIVSLLFVLVWIISRTRTATGLLASTLLLLICLVAPLNFIGAPERLKVPLLLTGLVIWAVCGGAFLCAPQLKPVWVSVRERWARLFARFRARYQPGHALDYLIGTDRPWFFALGQLLPIAVIPFFVYSPATWLYFLTILSAISGAITSFASVRSRALWLRSGWSRRELFRYVEAAYWRQNCYALTVQLIMLVGVGSFRGFRTGLLALGMPLLILTTAASTYLGLLVTRGIGWRESIAGIATMLFAMATAIAAAGEPVNYPLAFAMEAGLAMLALCYRRAALHRWEQLDWMQCRRAEFGLSTRSAA